MTANKPAPPPVQKLPSQQTSNFSTSISENVENEKDSATEPAIEWLQAKSVTIVMSEQPSQNNAEASQQSLRDSVVWHPTTIVI